MQKLYKYGFIGLSLAGLAFIGLVAVQDAPTMTMEEKLKGISCAWTYELLKNESRRTSR